LGAGSKLRSKYFSDSTIIAIEPLAERFMNEIEWCDLDDAAEVYACPAEERIEQCVDRANLIISVNVLDHCYDFEQIVENICAYLKTDGLAFLSFDKHQVTDALHPLSLDEVACNRIFAEKGLVIEEFSISSGDGSTAVYGHGSHRMNYWLRKARRLDRAEAYNAARISLEPETANKLLCDCLCPGNDEAVTARLGQLSTFDWHVLVQLSVWHGLAPLLYKRLKGPDLQANIPTSVKQRLQKNYFYHSGRSMRLHYQLACALQAFHAAGISVIVLKGAHLGALIYGNPALRPMQDLDVLIKPNDLPQAEALLRAKGYTLYGERAEYEQEHFHFHYHLPDPAELPIELHWQLLRPDTPGVILEMDELWERARPACIAGEETLVLAPEDLLLYVCMHTAYNHLFEGGLKACHDLCQIIAHYGATLDWGVVQERARRWQISRAVYLMLRLARDLLAAQAPEATLMALRPETSEQALHWAIERIFSTEPSLANPETRPALKSLNLAQFWQARRLADKVHILLTSLFPPPGILAQRYPISPASRKIYLYYALNVRDMVVEHLPVVLRLWQHDAHTVAQAEEKLRITEQGNKTSALTRWLGSA
jgi:hypothetical protein